MARIKQQEFAVIGLGRFGSSLAMTLVAKGHTVLGIDRDAELVQRYSNDITQTVRLDSTDEAALREIDIASYPEVVVAIGTNFEANLLTTVACKSLGVKRVICKANNGVQSDVLQKVGADRVILPEHEAGEQLAAMLSHPGFIGALDFGPNHSVSELRVPAEWHGQTIGALNLVRAEELHVIALSRGDKVLYPVSTKTGLAEGDVLLLFGLSRALDRVTHG